ncbi:Mu transposase C-terminal domain-containing protein [Parashewanella tropica]|uniref:Mu transposase C-terminal domain-containing protein n=1 Tax=Parashewanella tropica TaxID=2547970 RepID=UPI00105A5CAB|nr:Mu transposase C-terminal domain-containing protein [Parashewanella tropica]
MSATYNNEDFLLITNDDISRQFQILSCNARAVRLLDIVTGVESERKVTELDELIVSGNAAIQKKDTQARKRLNPESRDFGSYPEKSKSQARDRLKIVMGVIEAKPKSFSAKRLEPIISKLYSEYTFETLKRKPSSRSVIRWIQRFSSSGHNIRSLLPFDEMKGNRENKVDPRIEPYVEAAIKHFKSPECPSIAKSYDELKKLVYSKNAEIVDEAKKMKPMHYSAFVKRLEKEAPKELTKARFGKEAARKLFREAKQPQEISLILQRVEVDHTKLDLFIVDEKNFLPLGRPWVTALIDYKSKSILGFHIGFEPPSYLSIASALRHAILPKSYVKERYPEVNCDWNCYGIPKSIAVDRGKDFESKAFEDACMDLFIRIHRNPGRHAWYKGSIESYFNTLNKRLLNDLKGKVFPNIGESNNYNPQKNAVISFEVFMRVFHIWVIDIYQQSKVSKGTIIPRVSWEEDLDVVTRGAINRDALDIILCEHKTRMNSEKGIVLNHIFYDNEQLYKLRALTGIRKVHIKFTRENLGFVWVQDDQNNQENVFFKVPAINQKYASGLRLHQHEVIKNFCDKMLDLELNEENLALAKIKMENLISDWVDTVNAKKVSSLQKAARYYGVGQQSDQTVVSTVTKDTIENQLISSSTATEERLKKGDENESGYEFYDGKNNLLPDELEF